MSSLTLPNLYQNDMLNQMKYLLPILLMLAVECNAQFPTHSNTSTTDVSKVVGNWDSFTWFWLASDSQDISVYVKNGSSFVDMTGDRVGFKLGRYSSTGLITSFENTNITVSVSNVSVSVASTNIPTGGDCYAEFYVWDSTISKARTLAQGKIAVSASLFP
jgi:hypothetical protein